MDFIILWLSTIIISYTIDIKNLLYILKDVGTIGYKINFMGDAIKNNELTSINRDNKIIKIMPLINVFSSLQNTIDYSKNKDTIINELKFLKIIIKMNEKELQYFNNNPKGLNNLYISLSYVFRKKAAKKIALDDGSIIYYDYKDNEKEPTIFKTTGQISIFPDKEKIEILKETLSSDLLEQKIKNEQKELMSPNKKKIVYLKELKQEIINKKNVKKYTKKK